MGKKGWWVLLSGLLLVVAMLILREGRPSLDRQVSRAAHPAPPAPVETESRPLEVVSEPAIEAPHESPVAEMETAPPQTQESFADAAVISQRETPPDENGHIIRTRIVKTDFKYPHVRIEETVAPGADPGTEAVLRRVEMVADHILVKLRPDATEEDLEALNLKFGTRILKKMRLSDIYVVELEGPTLDAVTRAIENFTQEAATVACAEPDYVTYCTAVTPDDPRYKDQWALNNAGQSDIDAPEAWGVTTGSSNVKVAVIDTGVDYNHEDLAANMWANPGEIPGNGIDDDQNGFVDDVRGWDFVNEDSDPMDDCFHGTAVAGLIGAIGNNGKGVAGVSWGVTLVPVKCFDAEGTGVMSDAIEAISYARGLGVDVLSNSWGGPSDAMGLLLDAVVKTDQAGMVFVAAAGNEGDNIDMWAVYPACLEVPNVISVGATSVTDEMPSWSNYGPTKVDLGAPGASILSCTLNNGYTTSNGTSFSTPLVSGVCALMKARNPSLTNIQIKSLLLASTVRIPSLDGKCVSGGRLNAYKAVLMSSEPNMFVKGVVLIDDGTQGTRGNGDGVANPGERIGLRISLFNNTPSPAGGVSGTLELVNSPSWGSVAQGTASFGDIPAGQAASCGVPYLVDISSSAPANTAEVYRLAVNDGAGHSWSPSMVFTIHAAAAGGTGPVAYWKLDEVSGMTATDSGSGAGASGTLTGGVTWQSTPKAPLKWYSNPGSLKFQGQGYGSYVSMGNPAKLQVSTAMTLSCWVYKTGGTPGQGFITRTDGGSNYVRLGWGSTSCAYSVDINNGGTTRTVASSGTYWGDDSAWHHVAATYDGSTWKVYRDGVQIAGGAGSPPNAGGWYLGSYGAGYANGNMYGNLDDVRIYDRALSGAEITDLAAGNNGGNAPIPSTLTVTSPNGGENWTAGATANVTWTSTGSISNVKIELSTDGGASYGTVLISSVPNSGTATVNVPAAVTTTARVRVSDAANAAVNDTSNANFTIAAATPAASITVVSPNGGESWTAGGTASVTWTSTGSISNVKIELSTDGGVSYGTVLSTSVPNSGSATVNIPAVATTTARVRVSDVLNAGVNDTSNANFTIAAAAPAASLTVTSPNGGESWITGGTASVRWTSTGSVSCVKIELSTDGGASYGTVLSSSVANNGSAAVNVPAATTTTARVRVSDTTNASVNDVSNANFAISATGGGGGGTGPVAYWKLDELSGMTAADTGSGTAASGTLNGAVSWQSTPKAPLNWYGNPGSLKFQGQGYGSYVSVGNPAKLEVSAAMTLACWVYRTNGTPGQGFITRGDGTSNYVRLGWGSTMGSYSVDIMEGGANRSVTSAQSYWADDSAWHHVAATYDGAIWRVYRDGARIASGPDSSPNAGNWYLGSYGGGYANGNLYGNLDDVRIYDRALSAAEIADLAVGSDGGNSQSTITVTSPNGGAGDTWTAGATGHVMWISSGSISNVKIELSTDGGASYGTVLNSSVQNNGHAAVDVPAAVTTTTARVRVSDVLNPAVNDASNANFAIVAAPPPPDTLTVTSPNGGENWPAGGTANVTWTSTGSIANVKIEITTDAWVTPGTLLKASVPNNGAVTVNIPDVLTTKARVRVTSASNASVGDTSDANFSIVAAAPPASITVTSPNGGDTWTAGATGHVMWTSTGSISNVKIELSTDGGASYGTVLTPSVQNNGYTGVDVPAGVATTTARVRVSDVLNPAVNDASNANFTIVAAPPPPDTLTVTSPNGGENWPAGGTANVTWTSTGSIANVKIELTTDAWVTPGTVLFTSVPNNGSVTVNIPDVLTTKARVRVTNASNASVGDTSDANFSIVAAAPPASITVTSPNGGESWTAGGTANVTWTSTGSIANVKVELSMDGGASYGTVLKSSVANSGSVTVNVPAATTTMARVRVSDVLAASVNDTSNANFTIAAAVPPASLTVASPNGGENWTAGGTANVSWTSTGSIANVKIELSMDGGASYGTVLKSSVANNGSVTVNVPAATTTMARVRVSDVLAASVNDTSNANFTIAAAAPPASLTVTSPNGGESWTAGGTANVSWTSTGSISNVKVELSTDGGATYGTVLKSSVANNGSATVNVPASATTTARVRVSDAANASVNDTSNANFTIAAAGGGGGGTGPLAYWKLDEVSGMTAADSGSGAAASGTLNGAVTWKSTPRAPLNWYSNSGSLGFSGQGYGSYVSMGNPAKLQVSAAMTLACWVYKTGGTPGQGFITRTDGGANYVRLGWGSTSCAYSVDINNGGITRTVASAGSYWGDDSTWRHIAATYDGSTWKVYRDGVQIASGAGSPPNAGGWYLGSYGTGYANGNMYGNLDDVRIYDRALSAAEIADLAAGNNGGSSPGPTTLTVTSPNGGENWTAGGTASVTWTSTGSIANVKIELSTNSGTSYGTVLTSSVPNSGSAAVAVPAVATTTARVRVSDVANASVNDMSNANFTIAAAPAAQLAFTVQPSNVQAGSAILPAVQVAAKDAGGNMVTDYTGLITVSIGTNPGGGTLSGTLQANAVSGVATFHNLSINSAGYGYTLHASAAGLTNAASDRFNVSAFGVIPLVTVITAGRSHTMALGADGTVWTWGSNTFGELGDGTTTYRCTPVQVSGLTGVTAIAGGHFHSIALRADGTVWTWGRNDLHQLGDGTRVDQYAPVQVGGLTGVTAILGGGNYTVVLKGDGTVWTWGLNSHGELGNGTAPTTTSSVPVQVSGLTGVTAIASGDAHAMALKGDGTLWTWGSNQFGQLGDGTLVDRYTPVQVTGLAGVTSIAAGDYHTLALKEDGTVWAWGYNIRGQLGDGTQANRSTPVQVSGLTGVVAVAGGETHTVALKEDGTVWTWGFNMYGQLGDGTKISRTTPARVDSLEGVVAIAAGNLYTIAVKGDGTAWAWGLNSQGQLGDGTTVDRYTPVQIGVIVWTGSTLTVTSPNGGENWTAGGTASVTWTSTGSIAGVRIELSMDGGASYGTVLNSSVPDNGAATVSVPIVSTTTARVRVSDVLNAGVSDASNMNFTIAAAAPPVSLTVTSPNGGESWIAGGTANVAWTSTGSIANVRIDLSTDGGVSYGTVLNASVPNNGFAMVNVPSFATTTARVRLSDVLDAGVNDASNADFAIVAGGGGGSGPVAYWRLDETSGMTAVDSGSGVAANGTTQGTVAWDSIQKAPLNWYTNPGSLNFPGPGTGSYVSVGNPAKLQIPGAMTLACWVYRVGSGPGQGFIARGDGGSNYVRLGWWGSPSTSLMYSVDINNGGITQSVVSAGTYWSDYFSWHHIAATYDGAVWQLYRDGVQIGTGGGTPPNAGNWYLGSYGTGATNGNLYGNLDDVRIYDRALSAAEIGDLAAGLLLPDPPSEPPPPPPPVEDLSPWPMGGRNRGRTSLSQYPGPVTSHVKWICSMGWGFGYFSISVDKDGTIYTGCWDNYLYAINRDGTIKWTYEGKGNLSPVVTGDGKILWGAPGGRLVALDPADGHEVWSLITGDSPGLHPSPMIGRDGTIYLNLTDGAVAAVNPNGTAKWRFETGSAIMTPVAIGPDDTIYAANESTLFAINPNGTEKWRFQGIGAVGVDLAVSDTNTIYYCSGGNIYSVDATGKQNWSYPTGADRGIAIGPNGNIVVKSMGGSPHGNGFICLRPDGTFVWSFSLGANYNILVKPAIGANGMVYFGSWDSTIHAVDIADGKEKWSIYTDGWIECKPAIGKDGVLYIGSNSGRLYAIQDEGILPPDPPSEPPPPPPPGDGLSPWPMGGRNCGRTSLSEYPGPLTSHVNWTYSMGWGFGYFAISIGKDGTIYTGCWDNYLYAINRDGTLKWTYEGKGSLSPVVTGDGKVLWGAPGGRLVALDPADGHEVWSLTTGDGQGLHPSPMIGRDGTIYLNLADGAVAAVNSNGTAKWRFETGSAVMTPVAIGPDDTIYAANKSTLYAINPNGTEKWRFQGGGLVGSELVVSDTNTIYYYSGKTLYSVDATGKQNWSYPLDSDWSIAIGPNGNLVVKSGPGSAHGNGFICLRPDGTLVWSFPLGNYNILVKPAIGANGMVYFGSWDSTIHAVDIADGKEKWSIYTDGWIECHPAIGKDGVLYIGSNSGRLYAIQDE